MNSSPTEFIENITLRLGRSRKYFTSEEQAAAQRHNSLIHYHRKKQLKNKLRELEQQNNIHDGDIIEVNIVINSRVLRDYEEDLRYRVINHAEGIYQKI